jgi:hypothetical protein
MFRSNHLRVTAAYVVIVALFAYPVAAAPMAKRTAGPAPESGTQSWLRQVQQFVERHLEVGFFVTVGTKSLGTDPWLQPKREPDDPPCPSCSLIPPSPKFLFKVRSTPEQTVTAPGFNAILAQNDVPM